MRVAHIIQRYPPALGGSEAYFQRLSHYLAGQGAAVTVWTTNALDLEAFWSAHGNCLPAGENADGGVQIRRFALTGRVRGRRWLLKPLSMLPLRRWQCLTLPCNPVSLHLWVAAGRPTKRYDVVHATAFPYAWPIVCGLRLARRLRVPFFLTPFLHLGDPTNPADPTRRQYTAGPFRWLLRSADRVFVQTAGEFDAVCDLGVRPERIVRQGLGVDAAECTGGDRWRARAKWHVPGKTVIIGHLANNSVEKGTVDLLRAVELLWRQGIAFEIVLAGPEMATFRRFIAGYPFADRVRRLGVLSDEQRREFFAGIDVFALPSRSDSFGLVLLEAWANGLPNVVYRAGGPGQLVRDECDGLHAPCGDPNRLADELRRLIESAEMRRRLGEAGQRRVGREFRWPEKLEIVRAEMKKVIRDAEALRNGARELAPALRSEEPPRRG
jgi:glycosyltransferase involved in cell wall biosynthesis